MRKCTDNVPKESLRLNPLESGRCLRTDRNPCDLDLRFAVDEDLDLAYNPRTKVSGISTIIRSRRKDYLPLDCPTSFNFIRCAIVVQEPAWK